MEAYPWQEHLKLWRAYFGLAFLQGLGVIGFTLAAKSASESTSGSMPTFFSARLLIFVLALTATLISAWLLSTSWIHPQVAGKRAARWINWIIRPPRLSTFLLIFTILLLLSLYAATLHCQVDEPFSQAILDRLAPLLVWVSGMAAQTLVVLVYIRRLSLASGQGRPDRYYWLLMAYFALVFTGWIWISRSFLPSASTRVGWNPLGVPLLEYQVFLAWGAGMAIIILTMSIQTRILATRKLLAGRPWLVDLAISVLLWIGAVVLWQSQPILPNWFVSEKLAPNYAHYPYSDARTYDEVAQSALVGNGFRYFNNSQVRRPLHAAYLTVLHWIGGQDYEQVVLLQVLILALLPVGLYMTTRLLHNRASGVMAAVLLTLREANSVAISATITSSHVKLLLVDLLTALLVVFFAYWAVRWLKASQVQAFPALPAGGALALAALIRPETTVLALSPLILTSCILLPHRKFGLWFKQMALLLLGIMLVSSPWIIRNWQVSGSLFNDSSLYRYQLIIQRFRTLDENSPPAEKSEETQVGMLTPSPGSAVPTTPAAVPTSIPADIPRSTLIISTANSLVETALRNPGELGRFFAAHFLNSQIQMVLLFPSSYRSFDSGIALLGHRNLSRFWQDCCSLTGYTRRLPFWKGWNGQIPIQSILPIFLTTLLMAAGANIAWKKHHVAGLVPALAALFYITFNAALRNSGGRYLLPVDWVALLYFSIGSIHISLSAIQLVTGRRTGDSFAGMNFRDSTEQQPERSRGRRAFYLTLLILLAAGISIPLVEKSFPTRYNAARMDRMLANLLSAEEALSAETRQQLTEFLDHGGTAMAGRGTYAQIFPRGYGTQESDRGPRAPQPYPRLVFNLVGSLSLDITLPVEKGKVVFPDAADTLVLFCLSKSPLRATPLAVAVYYPESGIEYVYLRSPFPEKPSCPLPDIP